MNYLYIFGTILFTVYGQIILKWRIGMYGSLPQSFQKGIFFISKLFLDPFILSGFVAAFLASLCWMAAMTKFEISFAYPFMSLSFIFVLIISGIVLGESISIGRFIGLAFIIVGLYISVRY